MKLGRRRGPMAEINVVPYIDVMLVLLIIFMVTTPLLSQGVKVELPQASAQPISAKEEEPIILSVNSNGQYFLNIAPNPEQAIDTISLQNLVQQELQKNHNTNNPRQVLVKGDQNVDYGKVVQAMVLLQQAGASSVGLVTTSPEEIKS